MKMVQREDKQCKESVKGKYQSKDIAKVKEMKDSVKMVYREDKQCRQCRDRLKIV